MAVGWTWALAHLQGMWLPNGVLLGLALVVWIIYVADRLLDTCGVPVVELDDRHRFYRDWHGALVLGGLLPAVAVSVWLALVVLPSGLVVEALLLSPLMATYLVLYSSADLAIRRRLMLGGLMLLLLLWNALSLRPALALAGNVVVVSLGLLGLRTDLLDRLQNLLRKETAAGVLFALGCTAPERFLNPGDASVWLEMLVLSFLFTANLGVIVQIEEPPDRRRSQVAHLGLALLLTLGLGIVDLGGEIRPPFKLALLAGTGQVLHLLLWRFGQRLEADAFRVLADLALLLPLVALPWL